MPAWVNFLDLRETLERGERRGQDSMSSLRQPPGLGSSGLNEMTFGK